MGLVALRMPPAALRGPLSLLTPEHRFWKRMLHPGGPRICCAAASISRVVEDIRSVISVSVVGNMLRHHTTTWQCMSYGQAMAKGSKLFPGGPRGVPEGSPKGPRRVPEGNYEDVMQLLCVVVSLYC